jgi:hypothetical protein
LQLRDKSPELGASGAAETFACELRIRILQRSGITDCRDDVAAS